MGVHGTEAFVRRAITSTMRNAPHRLAILTMVIAVSTAAVAGEWTFSNTSDAIFAGRGYTPPVLDVDALLRDHRYRC